VGAPAATTVAPTAAPGDGAATISWTPPPTDNGAPVTGYVVTPYINGVQRTARTLSGTALSTTMTGLPNGSVFKFSVAAINSRGTGPASGFSKPVVLGAPTAPSGLTIVSVGAGSVTLRWTPPLSTNGAAIIGYVVHPFVGLQPQPAIGLSSTATTQTVTGLTPGVIYRFRVAAKNSRGVGVDSDITTAATPR
jgi:hypothetical protein